MAACVFGLGMMFLATAMIIATTLAYVSWLKSANIGASGMFMLVVLMIIISVIAAMLGASLAATFKPTPACVDAFRGTDIVNASGEAPVSEPVKEEQHEPEATAKTAAFDPEEEETASYPSGLTMESGVNYHNGRRETYYSSNVLYHYRTPEWTPDENGVYRDANGYVVVSASDVPEGSMLDTSFGMGIVYDCGCDYGTTDIYVNW